jgi:predicted RNA-binding protein with RPS1 domain
VAIADFGSFVDSGEDNDGLLHTTKLGWPFEIAESSHDWSCHIECEW